jgi:hypothetical protein
LNRDSDSPLAQLVAAELERSAPDAAVAVSDVIRERFGDCVSAVLFYGSCLRRQTSEGVLDFYVLVDSYREAYRGVTLPVLNALVPPNVFYLEHTSAEGTLRAKYAVLSRADFERAVGPAYSHPYIWARFCQPSLLVYSRDSQARALAITCAAQAIVTLVQRLSVFLPVTGQVQRFSLAALWHYAFARTYGSELRPESTETVRTIYEGLPERYDEAGGLALRELHDAGWIRELSFRGTSVEVEIPAFRRLLGRWRWHLERPIAKLLAFVRLLKNSATFGDWLPYALWKVQRHTGVEVELTERQRRHPLIFAWPVIFRLLRERSLR